MVERPVLTRKVDGSIPPSPAITLDPAMFSTKEVLAEHIVREARDCGFVRVEPSMTIKQIDAVRRRAPHLSIKHGADHDAVAE